MPGEVFPVVPTQQFQLFFKMLHIGITEPHKSSASLLFFSFLRIIQRLGFTGHNKMLDFILPKVFGYFHRIILAKRLIFRRVGGCGGIKALDFFLLQNSDEEHSSSAKMFPDTECSDSPWEPGQF